jgi:hypothetical protein
VSAAAWRQSIVVCAALTALPASAADYCALLARHGPAVFGTPLQSAPQCDKQSGVANNASGSDRLTLAVVSVPDASRALDEMRRDGRDDRKVSEEPALGGNAILVRTDNGRVAAFHVAEAGRYLTIQLRARDGLSDAYVERARQFAKVAKAAKAER